jgi:hypothetical protein
MIIAYSQFLSLPVSIPAIFVTKLVTVMSVKVQQSLYSPIADPEGSRRLTFPDFKTIDT